VFTPIMNAVLAEFRGQAAKNAVERIAPHHRLSASPGYRAAARVCRQWLADEGIASKLQAFPADGKTVYWSFIAGTEWDADEGTLHVVEPAAEARKLADWDDFRMSLMSGSTTADVAAPLAVAEDHWKEADFKAADLKGKIVLTRDVGAARRLAVDKFGAVGVVSDWFRRLRHVRETGDLTDTLHMQGLGSDGGHKKTFGFVVSPRAGMHLRKLVAERAARGQSPVMLHARVRARRGKGTYEVLSAEIPGRTKEMVLVLAHLCHAQWSANDNASGCAASMELLRTIKTLIERKALQQPKRGIRILLVPEYAGSYVYLARSPAVVANAIAGINLDMVGEDQTLCKTSFCCERPPAAAGSFIGDLAEAIQWALPQDGSTPSSTDRFPLIRQATTEFSGWSDHDVLSDPTVGIPSPMLIQWPDLFYHTTDDTIDKVDPASLHRAGCLAATYAYFLADAGEPEARWIAAHSLGRFKERIVTAAKQAAKDAIRGGPAGTRQWLEARIAYLTHLGCRCLDSVRTLAKIDVGSARAALRQLADAELAAVRDALPKGRTPRKSKAVREAEAKAAAMVPVRLYKGPLALGRQLQKLSKAKREAWNEFNKNRTGGSSALRLTPRTAQFWADGTRTILQIADCLEQDTGGERDVEYLVRYFRLLADLKLARIEKPKAT
jgi:aminopeptidase YwaD